MANIVDDLMKRPFPLRSLEEKLEVKLLGRPTPDLNITQRASGGEKGNEYTRKFNRKVYENIWVCGCEIRNALFCFPCLLFGNVDAWCKGGVKDLGHLNSLIKKHEVNEKHMNNVLDLCVLGCVNISTLLSHSYHDEKVKHNQQVERNRYQLSEIIDCIRFCGAFELSLRHDLIDSSENGSAIAGLIDLSSSIDDAVKVLTEDNQIFRDASNSIKNDLLDCMLETCREVILEDMNRAEFVAVMVDEMTDATDKTQLAFLFRYEKSGMPYERFWGFFSPAGQNADAITTCILDVMHSTFKDTPHKIIALTFDGASVMSICKSGILAKVRILYPNIHYIHCYAYQLYLTMERAASQNQSARVFFLELSGFRTFFSGSPERLATFQSVVVRRIPNATVTRWNFQSRTVNVLYEYKNCVVECLSILQKTSSNRTCNLAVGLRRSLEDWEFLFWLGFFYKVMPHVDSLHGLLQTRSVDAVKVKLAVLRCIQAIDNIRNSVDKTDPLVAGAATTDQCRNAKEVCDSIVTDIQERFLVLDYLEASKLMDFSKFEEYASHFPSRELNIAAQSYSMLEKRRLKMELSALYQSPDFRNIEGAVPFLQFILTSSIEETFFQVARLLRILVTTPLTTAEPERCFTSLKKIKTFLRNTMPQQGLCALGMLAVEKSLVANIEGFNSKVVEKFCRRKGRLDFVFHQLFGLRASQCGGEIIAAQEEGGEEGSCSTTGIKETRNKKGAKSSVREEDQKLWHRPSFLSEDESAPVRTCLWIIDMYPMQ